MTDQIKDGGPAFPMPASEHSQGGHFEQIGMSLRDHFAGQALPTVLSLCVNDSAKGPEYSSYCARLSYEVADAMLKAREAKP